MKNIKPLEDRVLVKKIDHRITSSIVLPESVKSPTNIGEVIAVGPGRVTDDGKQIPIEISVGQKVIFSWGEQIEIDGIEYHIINSASVLAIIE